MSRPMAASLLPVGILEGLSYYLRTPSPDWSHLANILSLAWLGVWGAVWAVILGKVSPEAELRFGRRWKVFVTSGVASFGTGMALLNLNRMLPLFASSTPPGQVYRSWTFVARSAVGMYLSVAASPVLWLCALISALSDRKAVRASEPSIPYGEAHGRILWIGTLYQRREVRLIAWTIVVVALIMFPYVRFVTYLTTRVYQPIGTISEADATLALWNSMIGLPYFLMAVAAPVVVLLCILLAGCFWKRPRLRIAFVMVALVHAEVLLFARLQRENYEAIFRDAFLGVTVRGKALISAIESYNKAKGRYPERLELLVPDFIPEIPSTGLAGYPSFEYERADSKASFKGYQIFVNTPIGVLNWDKFVYRPGGDYYDDFPEEGLERFGDWVYFHE